MKTLSVLALLLTNAMFALAQKTTNNFDIEYKGETIGVLTALKETKGTLIVKDLKSNTDTKVMMISVHVESEVMIAKEQEVLIHGKGYRHANRGPSDVQTTVIKTADKKYKVITNGKEKIMDVPEIKFCVVDLYFTEPVGVSSIFSNTVGDFLKLTALGNGSYKLSLPDGKTTMFYYSKSVLTKVVAEAVVGTVTFKRKG